MLRLISTILAGVLLFSCVETSNRGQLASDLLADDIDDNDPVADDQDDPIDDSSSDLDEEPDDVLEDFDAPTSFPESFIITIVSGLETSGNLPTVDTGNQVLADQAAFNSMQGLARFEEYVYIADRSNHGIKAYDTAQDTVGWFAGSGRSRSILQDSDPFSFVAATEIHIKTPFGLKVTGDFLYFTSHDGRVSRLMLNGPTNYQDIEIAGTNSRQSDLVDGLPATYGEVQIDNIKLNRPNYLFITADHVYVSDQRNSLVRKISLDFSNNGSGRSRMVQNIMAPSSLSDPRISGVAIIDGALYFASNNVHYTYVLVDVENAPFGSLELSRADFHLGDGVAGLVNGYDPRFNRIESMSQAGTKLYLVDNSRRIRVIAADGRVETPDLIAATGSEAALDSQGRLVNPNYIMHYQGAVFFLSTNFRLFKLEAQFETP